MATELEPVVRQLFDNLDKLDFEVIRDVVTSDAQGVDEISRRWLRSSDDIAGYFAQLKPMLANVESELKDVHETTWGDTGLVTFWLEQNYVLGGEAQHVSAPTSIVLRREGGTWKVALLHSVPLPPEE